MISPIDPTKPNISRIYDYVLGGHHNFEMDRLAAQQILVHFPSYPLWARLNRWFLQMVAHEWRAAGISRLVDLGSGMPTQEHFHAVMPEARILYSDNDPIAVAYAQEVIGTNPLVSYVECDVRDAAALLAAAERHFGAERQVAVGLIGISYFLDERSLRDLFTALYDWAAPGSTLAVSFVHSNSPREQRDAIMHELSQRGMTLFPRDPAELEALAAPWSLQTVRPLNEWLGVEKQLDPADVMGNMAEMYGAIFARQG